MNTENQDAAPADAPGVVEDPAARTKLAVQEVSTNVASFLSVQAGIAAIAAEHPADLIVDVTTTKGMASAVAARAAWRGPRIELEKRRKAAKAPIVALGKDIDALAGSVEEQLRVGESNYDRQIKAEEDRKESLREEARKVEAAKKAAIEAELANIRNMPLNAVGADAGELLQAIETLTANTLEQFDEVWLPTAQQVKDGALEALRRLHNERARLDNAAEDLAKQQAELDAKQAQAAQEAQEREDQAQRDREQAEATQAAAQRIQEHIQDIRSIPARCTFKTAEELLAEIADLKLVDPAHERFGDRQGEAAHAVANSLEQLASLLTGRVEADRVAADQSERQKQLDAQEQAQAEQRQKDADAAEERRQADAQREREEQAARDQQAEAERQQAETDRLAAEAESRALAVKNATLRTAAEFTLKVINRGDFQNGGSADCELAVEMLEAALTADGSDSRSTENTTTENDDAH